MKRLLSLVGVLVVGLTLAIQDAEAARRLGGGRSLGTQRDSVMQRQAQPPARDQVQAPSQAQAPAAAPQPTQMPAPRPGMSRWLAPLAGLAAGLGLAALFGAELGGILTALVLGIGLALVLGLVLRAMRRRSEPALQGAGANASYYSGVGHETVAAPPPSQATGVAERPVSDRGGAPGVNLPADFDAEGFVRQAKKSFIALQTAHDRGDLAALRELTTDEMFDLVKADVGARSRERQQVDIVTLEATLVEVTTERDMHWASIRFSGMLREEEGGAPVSFEEVWNLRKPASGESGWLLAGIQQLA